MLSLHNSQHIQDIGNVLWLQSGPTFCEAFGNNSQLFKILFDVGV